MWLRSLFSKLIGIFSRKKHIKLGLYGPPNGGKTTLANRICADWLGEEMGSTSRIAHETRKLYRKEHVTVQDEQGRTIRFSLVDTPGMSQRIDFEDFVKDGISEKEAKQRAREAMDGVLQSVRWLNEADAIIVVLDSTKEPTTQVNTILIDVLNKRSIPFFIVANKMDLKSSSLDRVQTAFPQYNVLPISAKYGDNIERFYERLFDLTRGEE